jgi:hypothetical protein
LAKYCRCRLRLDWCWCRWRTSAKGRRRWVKDRYGEPQRGEWMRANENSSPRRWKLQQDERGFQHTSPTHYLSWPSPRSHWSATGPRNQHTAFRPENAAEHQTSSLQTNTGQTGEHHRSDRSLLVKLSNFHKVAPHRSDRWDTPVRPV